MDSKEFIEKAKKIQGDKYDYSLIEYVRSKDKVKIICKEHGVFEQRASGHLTGYSCHSCQVEKQRIGINKFIEKAKKIHGGKYDYSNVIYKNYDTKVKIICKEHGVFEQTPNNHLKGGCCKKCSFLDRRIGDSRFIERVKKIHGDEYDYSLIEYRTMHVKIKIKCLKHGLFEQTPHNHLKGDGCPACYHSSKGEKLISGILNENNIKFIPQHRFNDCKDKIKLPFDFYLPDYSICIEYNGIQHYKPVEYFGGVDGLKEQQRRDKIKLNYCDNNEILLIVVKYNEKIINLVNKILKHEKNKI